jgi:hypothetical protein
MKQLLLLQSCENYLTSNEDLRWVEIVWAGADYKVRLYYRQYSLISRWYVRVEQRSLNECELSDSIEEIVRFVEQRNLILLSSQSEIKLMVMRATLVCAK